MILDLHVHIAGADLRRNGNYWNPKNRRNLFLGLFMRQLGLRTSDVRHENVDNQIRGRLTRWLSESAVDAAVVLALDGAYTEDGEPDSTRTRMIVGNDYVAALSESAPKVLFGASVHPYRKDALPYLERVIRQGACLVKWLPSAQGIDPSHPKCVPYFEMLAHFGVPLLSHTGIEHALSGGDQSLNDPRHLIQALKRGVTVIAAHCGTRVFLYEKSSFALWCRMALEHPQFYGDLSAFFCPTRMSPLRAILNSPPLLAKVLYGSDFPVSAIPAACFPALGLGQIRSLNRVANPFDRSRLTMQALGLPESVFERGREVIRIPARQTVAEAR